MECAFSTYGEMGEVEVKRYEEQGSYFGELALLKSEPRKASIRAVTEVSVAAIQKDDFESIVGPLC